MKLTQEQIRSITQGAVDVTEKDGYIRFLRFTARESAVICNPNLEYPAGVQLLFRTDGTSLSLQGRTAGKTGVRSYYAFDIYENDRRIGVISNLQDQDAVGNFAPQKYPTGDFSAVFPLTPGEKQIRIVLPHSVLAEISELTITDATHVVPVRREKKLLAYGDSITQGYDALHPSDTYPMRLAEALGAELINKGIGGACFTPALAAEADGVRADIVLAAYGTNDWNCFDKAGFIENAAGFFANLTKNYPDVPLYVITPIWRGDSLQKVTPFGAFSELEEVIRALCSPYPHIHVISGTSLVPHTESCFGDLFLHPNGTGFAEYAANLLAQTAAL